MADKKEKNAVESKGKKKENPFKKMGASVKKFFKDFKGECAKVTWPTGKTVLNNSLVVIVVVAIVGVVIFGIDTGLSKIIDVIVSFASKQETAEMINTLFFLR